MSISKTWNCTSCFAECNFSFLKNARVWLLIITYDYLLIIQTWKNRAEKLLEDVCWSYFFRIGDTFFQSFCTKFLSFLCMRSLVYKISHCLSANHTPELRCVIYTGVTLFAPVLHFLYWCYAWTALLSANQNQVIFHVYYHTLNSLTLFWLAKSVHELSKSAPVTS